MPVLEWITKEWDLKQSFQVPYRLLQPVPELAAGDLSLGNMLIEGDNLEALVALRPLYAGSIRCAFIDPPYNTRSAFEQYDDNLEHTKWLAMMYPRLELLRDLLSLDGSIWITIDDNEAHYLKVVMDEVFGRANFVANVLWQKRTSPDARLTLGAAHDHLLVYARDVHQVRMNKVERAGETTGFSNPDGDPRGAWSSTDFTAQGWRPNQMYTITTPGGAIYNPPDKRCWANVQSAYEQLLADNRMWFGQTGMSRPRQKHFLAESPGVTTWTWWTNKEVGHNQEAKKESNELFGADNAFDTPKPERLLRRVIELSTDPGDFVLDSFLGSGTTAAVAHKMGRRYIGVEAGEQARKYCVVRLKKVVDGERGGISEAVDWRGGGGFKFLRLGETVFDNDGRINPAVTFAQLSSHVWFTETKTPLGSPGDSPLLGISNGIAYYLLFNGILGDRRLNGGNILTRQTLSALPPHEGPRVIFGESSRIGADRLSAANITFKQTPYEIKFR